MYGRILIVGRDHAGVGGREWTWEGIAVRQLPVSIDDLAKPTGQQGADFEVDLKRLDAAVAAVGDGYSGILCEGGEAFLLNFVRRMRGLKAVNFVVEEADRFWKPRRLAAWIERVYGERPLADFIASQTNWWVSNVSVDRDFYVSLGLPMERFHHIPSSRTFLSFLHPEAAKLATPATSETADAPVFAAITDEASFHLFREAVQGLSLRFTAAGVPPARAVDAGASVECVGYLPLATFLHEMRQSKFVVIPRRPKEQSPYRGIVTTGLALASGKPVVAPGTPAIAEYVGDGRSGFLYDPSRSDSLREAILRLDRDAPAFQQLSKGAVEDGQRLDGIARDGMLRVFGSVIEAAAGGRR